MVEWVSAGSAIALAGVLRPPSLLDIPDTSCRTSVPRGEFAATSTTAGCSPQCVVVRNGPLSYALGQLLHHVMIDGPSLSMAHRELVLLLDCETISADHVS